jgi:hypothetical protein
MRQPQEHAIFDPEAVMIRRGSTIPGGMDKRYQGLHRFGWRHFEFLHNIIGHYFPIRFVLLYPAYAVLLWVLMLDRIISQEERGLARKLCAGAADHARLAVLVGRLARQAVGTAGGHGPPVARTAHGRGRDGGRVIEVTLVGNSVP